MNPQISSFDNFTKSSFSIFSGTFSGTVVLSLYDLLHECVEITSITQAKTMLSFSQNKAWYNGQQDARQSRQAADKYVRINGISTVKPKKWLGKKCSANVNE